MKVSKIYFAGAIAAEAELPLESRELIVKRDALAHEWGKAGWPTPVPPELVAAGEAVRADPLANAAMEIRRLGNEAFQKEVQP